MKALSERSKSVIEFLKANPTTPIKEVAQKFNMRESYVYKLRGRKRTKKVKLTATQLELAKRLNVTPVEYAKSIAKFNKALKSPRASGSVDMVNHPPHYKTGGVETIDFIEAKDLGYHLGNVIKYVSRAKHKGNELEDLKKAQWYLERAIMKLHI